MPLSDNAKIMIGWAAACVSGGITFYGLRQHVEYGRKERMRKRKQLRKERKQKAQTSDLKSRYLASGQMPSIASKSS